MSCQNFCFWNLVRSCNGESLESGESHLKHGDISTSFLELPVKVGIPVWTYFYRSAQCQRKEAQRETKFVEGKTPWRLKKKRKRKKTRLKTLEIKERVTASRRELAEDQKTWEVSTAPKYIETELGFEKWLIGELMAVKSTPPPFDFR